MSSCSQIDSLTTAAEAQLQGEQSSQVLSSQRQQLLSTIRLRSSKNRDRMIVKYNNQQSGPIVSFTVGDYVTIFIPKQDRASTDDRRIPARIIGKKHGNRYELQTQYGVLTNYYGSRHLEPVPIGVLSTIDDNPTKITLRTAARSASRNQTGPVRATCGCKTACDTKRCGCYKANRRCTVHCHPRGIGHTHCTNNQDLVETQDEQMGSDS